MSGEPENYDDNDDFLDDFVLDEADANEPLPVDFDDPAPGVARAAGADHPGEPTEEDMLFEDRSAGLNASVSFSSDRTFSESGGPPWDGDELELDSEEQQQAAKKKGRRGPVDLEHDDEAIDLGDSALQAEDEFALDSEQELEIVGEGQAPVAAGADDFDSLETFLVEDEQEWQPEVAEGAIEADAELQEGDVHYSETGEYIGPLTEATAAGRQLEPGWEPLPGANLDELSEVDGVDMLEGEEGDYADYADEDELAAVGAGEEHDIYADVEEDPGVVGTYRSRRRLSVFASLAAALLVIGGAAVAYLRPEWIGLRHSPQQVEIVRLQRPQVRVEVGTPPMPVPAEPGQGTTKEPRVVVTDPPATGPGETPPTEVGPGETPPVAVGTQPGEGPTETDPATGTEPGATPVPSPGEDALQWPVAVAGTAAPKVDDAGKNRLLRVGNDLLIGEAHNVKAPSGVEGVPAGVRAFAQLENGNYFVGSVKTADAELVTLKLPEGEISLPRASVVKLTELGSADYETLQRATSGFVRLTNSNRLIGGILRTIADDHVVLESKSNRVMLPRSAIEEIVEGGDIGEVRIGTTSEEEEWLRRLSERQLEGTDPRATHAAPGTNGGGN